MTRKIWDDFWLGVWCEAMQCLKLRKRIHVKTGHRTLPQTWRVFSFSFSFTLYFLFLNELRLVCLTLQQAREELISVRPSAYETVHQSLCVALRGNWIRWDQSSWQIASVLSQLLRLRVPKCSACTNTPFGPGSLGEPHKRWFTISLSSSVIWWDAHAHRR